MYSSCRDIRLWFIVFNGKSISRIYCLVTCDRILHTSWKSNLAQSSKAMLFRGKYLLVVCEKKEWNFIENRHKLLYILLAHL